MKAAMPAAMPMTDLSSTGGLSNTVCISDPDRQWPTVETKAVKELSEFGQIARLDTSLVAVARCILVTFFDVRSAQRVILSSPGRCEPFPPAAHDCRTVRVKLSAFAEKVEHVQGGFNQFGEVANISASMGVAIVEYYDLRSAQMLLVASEGTATPYSQEAHSPAAALLASLGQWSPTGGLNGVPRSSYSSYEDGEGDDLSVDEKGGKSSDRAGNRPVRTKVSTKEFQKYDIDPDRIQRGEDMRTTVMVRNITGANARKDFLNFLDKCALGDRFSFFYMPCKEHRNVPAGFAFVNFITAHDVHKLFVLVKTGVWREFMTDPQSKAPGMSYARFQGHEELAKHFSCSAVLHEQDADKRPIFRPEAAAKAAQEKQRIEDEKKQKKQGERMLSGVHKVTPSGLMSPSLGTELQGLGIGLAGFGGDQHRYSGLLSQGVNEIAAILSRQKAEPSEMPAPAYLKAPSMSPYPQTDSQQAFEMLKAAKHVMDGGAYVAPSQMGA